MLSRINAQTCMHLHASQISMKMDGNIDSHTWTGDRDWANSTSFHLPATVADDTLEIRVSAYATDFLVIMQLSAHAFSAILARSSHITRGAVKRFVEAHMESKERIVASEYDIKRVRRWEAIVMRVLRQNVDANGAADSGWRFAGLQTFTESLFLAADEHENRAGMGGDVLEERLGSKAHSGVRFAVSESSPIGNGSRIPGSQAEPSGTPSPVRRRRRRTGRPNADDLFRSEPFLRSLADAEGGIDLEPAPDPLQLMDGTEARGRLPRHVVSKEEKGAREEGGEWEEKATLLRLERSQARLEHSQKLLHASLHDLSLLVRAVALGGQAGGGSIAAIIQEMEATSSAAAVGGAEDVKPETDLEKEKEGVEDKASEIMRQRTGTDCEKIRTEKETAKSDNESPKSRQTASLIGSSISAACIGIEFSKKGAGGCGPCTIEGLKPGGAAELCGLVAVGDLLHGVDDTSVYELDMQQTMELIPGPIGSEITLWMSKARTAGDPSPPITKVKLKRNARAKGCGSADVQASPADSSDISDTNMPAPPDASRGVSGTVGIRDSPDCNTTATQAVLTGASPGLNVTERQDLYSLATDKLDGQALMRTAEADWDEPAVIYECEHCRRGFFDFTAAQEHESTCDWRTSLPGLRPPPQKKTNDVTNAASAAMARSSATQAQTLAAVEPANDFFSTL